MSSSTAYVSGIVDDDGMELTYQQMLIDIRDELGIDMRRMSKLLGISSAQLITVLSDATFRFANERCERNVEIAWGIINGSYDGSSTSRGYGLMDDIKQAIVAAGDLKPINGPVLRAWEMLGGD